MKPIDQYIRQLLFDYDCVTIPGLGGFIMHGVPSAINPQKHRIYPPSRLPAFNSLLSHDDGLLISTIAEAEQLDYREAGSRVSRYVEEIKKQMKEGHRTGLAGIGELFYGTDNTLQFRQDNTGNLDPESFGLSSVSLALPETEKRQAQMVQKTVVRREQKLRTKQPASVIWTLLLSFPVILFLLYGIIFPASVQRMYTNLSGISVEIFHRGKPAIYTPPAESPAPVVILKEVIPQAEPTQVVKTEIPAGPKYYIIGGCFTDENNAEKFFKSLIDKGYEAEIAGRTKTGQTRISYKSFTEKSPALSYLQKIRSEENASAWLLKY